MRIVIDRNTFQVQAHTEHPDVKGLRLKTFLELLRESTGAEAVFSDGRMTPAALSECDLLIIPIRTAPFDPDELDSIQRYVKTGGRLFHLSTHAPFHAEDDTLARRFGLGFENSSFKIPDRLAHIPARLVKDHPVTLGRSGERAVRTIVFNSCGSVIYGAGQVVAWVPMTAGDLVAGKTPYARAFAVALDGRRGDPGVGQGRLFAIANCGLLGTKGTDYPGKGLIDEGDNKLFVERAVRWLLE
ncbi:MAG: hypothetical protein FJ319_08840 [SAR202 cluster bacterium]|nr:hypothetical protein [SAR202 cluster bacterium]